jgi:hypothetical protein
MKVLFDCILTSSPAKCSTTIQFVTLAGLLLEADPTCFIYWPIPDRLDDEEKAFYPVSDRILYLPIRQHKDRMREYLRLSDDMAELISFYSVKTWDWDVLVTVRVPQIAQMRAISTSPRQPMLGWMRKIIAIEDMMVLSKKPTVGQSAPESQDRMLLASYLDADITLIPAYHEKTWVAQVAAEHVSFSARKTLNEKLREVCQLRLSKHDYGLKTEHRYKGDRKLGVAFVGRLERFGTRIHVMNDMLKNQFILHSETVRPFVCTVTEGDKFLDAEAIEVLHPAREEFWRISREEMDVALAFSVDVELSLSKLEPVMFGVPLIAIKAPWSVGMLGESYPFYVANETEGFGMINLFKNDYEGMYAKFAEWYSSWFVPEYTRRENEDGMYNHLLAECLEAEARKVKLGQSGKTNGTVAALRNYAGTEFVMADAMSAGLHEDLTALKVQSTQKFAEEAGLIWMTNWQYLRVALKLHFGYQDAGVRAGHLKKE